MMTRILEPQLVGNDELARLLDTAAASTRKRAHLLLHADHQDQVQRLLIGLSRRATSARTCTASNGR